MYFVIDMEICPFQSVLKKVNISLIYPYHVTLSLQTGDMESPFPDFSKSDFGGKNHPVYHNQFTTLKDKSAC